jgi:hypothetical protein
MLARAQKTETFHQRQTGSRIAAKFRGNVGPENAYGRLLVSAISAKRCSMILDPVLLTRLQLAWGIAWYIVLPVFVMGASSRL